MAVRRRVVCLFRQAIEQTRYRKKVNRSCNANRHHPSECRSPVRQFCEPTGHRPPRTTRHCSNRAPGCRSSSCFSNEFNMVNVEMANKRRKNRLMKKHFWRLGCVETRIRSDARRADLPPAPRAGSINDVAECGCASLIGPWNKHFSGQSTSRLTATATMRRTSN
jgi:hypothetical protein